VAWSGALVDDFVLMDFEVTNLRTTSLKDLYVCVRCQDISVGDYYVFSEPGELTGFLKTWPFEDQCGEEDSLMMAYRMDDDGDPVNGRFSPQSRRGAVGVMYLGGTPESVDIGYTWVAWAPDYAEDWGPRRRPIDEPWKSFNPFFAWPGSNANLYYIMTHPTIAYDQMFAAVEHYGWFPPSGLAELFASGWSTYAFYTFGPFDIPGKDKINFTIAVVGGDNVHTDPTITFNPYSPQYYYDQLDFSELAENARWAQWVYDNPGVDTDSDGYFGEYRICDGDTNWYKGDGVPDFRGASPPPPPSTRVTTERNRLVIRFNGYLCETTKDPFSGMIDFEGYRVYCGLDNRRSSLSLLTSYDKLDFFRLKYSGLGIGEGKWISDEPPYSLDSLKILHNDPDFDPLRYDRNRPLIEGDSVFRFEPVDANRWELGLPRGLRKVYPDAVDPGTDSLLWTDEDVTLEHGRRLPKYYEYEYVHDNLLPSVAYTVSVTAFDFGFTGGRGNMPPQESNPLANLIEAYAQTSAEDVVARELDVYVYPNPYRVDAAYHEHGFENRAGRLVPDRARLIHFGNLPPKCKISIFSLDGDLIGTKQHDFASDDPQAMHDDWNLVSRSGLAVESGLYYWVVESEGRTQIGKLVIIK
jgi:hypothetical protein